MASNARRLFLGGSKGLLMALVVVFIASYAQTFHLFSFGGVNPDVAPIMILVLAFFERNTFILFASSWLMFFFFFSPFWWSDLAWLALILTITLLVKVFLSLRGLMGTLLSASLFSILFPTFFWDWSWLRVPHFFIQELLLNCILSCLVFFLFSVLKKERQ